MIKAIETVFDGITYRSRTEARWAMFFTGLRVPFKYEYEGYELPAGRYLPDFWLPKLETWVEIKGVRPTDREDLLCGQLALATDNRVILMRGDPGEQPDNNDNDSGYLYAKSEDHLTGKPVAYWDNLQWPCVCNVCGKFDFQFEGRGNRVCGDRVHPSLVDKGDRGHSHDDPVINGVLEEIRSHRFWDKRG